MASRQDNTSSRNQQNNTSTSVDSILTDPGDIMYRNNINVTRRLPIGEEDFQLTVSNGEANWRRSTGELFKIGYFSIPAGNYWNATYGESGVPFNQTSLSRYNHANKIYANLKYIENTGSVLTKSTSSQGGYTTGNITLYKANCQELWCTIDTDNSNLDVILNNLGTTGAGAISQISSFAQSDSFFGIDLLLTESVSLTVTSAASLNTWLGDLKTELTNNGIGLNLTLPSLSNSTIASSYNFDYSTFVGNVDTITIDCCCQQVEFGYGMGQCPIEMLIGGVYDDIDMCSTTAHQQGQTTFYEGGVLGKYASDNDNNYMDKLVLALPSEGFSHLDSAGAFTITSNLTRNVINYNSTYSTNTRNTTAERDQNLELRWANGTYTFSYCDGVSMRRKAEICRQWLKKWELDNPSKTKPIYEMIFKNMGGNNPSYYE